jgi:CRP/FNR family cyclic AMP-dependent transcriptional regulator
MSRDFGGRLSTEMEFDFDARGETFVTTDKVRGVILAHLNKREVEPAARLIATSAPEVGDLLLTQDAAIASKALRETLAEAFVLARDFDRAGRAAVLIGDPARAAPFFERSYQFAQAAQLYEQAGQLDKAADLYERDLRFDLAARFYEQSNQIERAAAAWERANGWFDAGRLWAKARRLDRAVELLQKVEPGAPRYPHAMLLLGRILEHSGHTGNAAASYIGVVKSCPLDEVTVEVYERLAALYVATGEPDAARKLYAAVVRFDPNREAASRGLAALGGERTTTSPGGPAPSLAPPAAAPMLSLAPPAAPAASPSSPPPAIPGTVRPLVLPPPPGSGSVSAPASQAKLTAVHGDVDVLRELPLLAELSLDELRALQAIGARRRFVNGEILIEQGREGENLFVVLSGKVRVLHLADSGSVTALGELGYGAALGDMALVDSGPTSARVEAVGAAEAYVWPLAQLRPYLASHEGTALRILRVVSRTLSVRLRETNRRAARDA